MKKVEDITDIPVDDNHAKSILIGILDPTTRQHTAMKHGQNVKFEELKEGWASKNGVQYEVANGDRIPNIGEKQFQGTTEEGVTRNITAQVCDVNKALLSVKKIIAAGNRVVFDESGSYIEDKKNGERMWLREDKGMFMLKMWVKSSVF